jgi:hypothetical protein
MFRLKLAMAIIGGVMVFYGFQEYRVSSGSSSTAESVNLAELEGGTELDNTYIKVGPHLAFYDGSIYVYESSEYSNGEPGPSSKVNYTYYPIISLEHSFNVGLDEIAEKYGDNVPENVKIPDLNTFSILVKTKRFSTIGAIPDYIEKELDIRGLVINRIHSLKSDEKRLINETFPTIDTNKILILEEGRRPSSFVFWGGLILGGLALIVVGLGWLVAGFTSH